MFQAFCRDVAKWFWIVADWCQEHKRVSIGIACLVLGFILGTVATKARAEADTTPHQIAIDCDDKDVCKVSRDELMKVGVQYFAALKELEIYRSKGCGKYRKA